jgi:hypothetical protein
MLRRFKQEQKHKMKEMPRNHIKDITEKEMIPLSPSDKVLKKPSKRKKSNRIFNGI